jgi:hypothetical protein
MLTPSTSVVKVYGVNIVPGGESGASDDRTPPRYKGAEFKMRESPAIVRIQMLS